MSTSSDIKIGEAVRYRLLLIETATGNPWLLQVPLVTVIDESGNQAVAAAATEESNGYYHYDFTPDAAGTWTIHAALAGGTFYFFPLSYKAGSVSIGDIYDKVSTEVADIKAKTDLIGATVALEAGGNLAAVKAKTDNLPADPADASDIKSATDTIASYIDTEVGVIDGLFDVPAKDSVNNATVRDVVGQKTDTPKWFFTDTQSAMALLKGAVHSGGGISYAGTCDAGMAASLTVVVCVQLAGFGDDFFNTDYVLKVVLNDNSHGASPEADAARDITDYDTATGTFTTAAFNNNVEAGDKIVVSKRSFYITDQIAVQTIPGTNSLAYRLSQFLADGDGDFATGTALPANTSLYDIIGGGNGHPAFPAAAAPANGISMLEVIHLIADRTEHHEVTKTFFSRIQPSVTVTAAAPNLALPSITLPNWAGTIVHVYAGFKFRMVENTNAAANKIDTLQYIQVQKAAGALTNCIAIPDDVFGVAITTREGGDAVPGDIDVVATVDVFNATYNFQWTAADADVANLVFNDVQTFLIVSYY